MTPKPKRWEIAPTAPPVLLSELSRLPPLMVQLLYNRGIHAPDQVEEFLGSGSLGDPFAMPDMSQAVTRVRRAIQIGEPIAVYGDYDADGVTATSLVVQVLSGFQARVEAYIPRRADEGYGLNRDALDELAARGTRLLITVDCGIRSLEEAEHAHGLGMDLIVTDHHSPGPILPRAVACVDAKCEGSRYPFRELSGVGVAFKVAQALLISHNHAPIAPDARRMTDSDFLDLVALGTVADLAPLLGENRTLVKQGLEKLNSTVRPGLRALIELGGLKAGQVNAGHVGYVLGPRLNAAGRLDTAMTSFDLLITQDAHEGLDLAQKLDKQNRERQRMTAEAVARARERVLAEGADECVLFVVDPDVPGGVAGLVASRLLDEFYRPAVVIHLADQASRGSARSIPEFDITGALDQCADLLIRHGGHAAAAGFEAHNINLPRLRQRLQDLAASELQVGDLVASLTVDAEVDLRSLDWDAMRMITAMEPFGYGNRAPLFASRNIMVLDSRIVGARHLKLRLSHQGKVWDAIAFRQSDWASCLPPRIDLAYALEINTWNGVQQLQLNVRDIHPTGADGPVG